MTNETERYFNEQPGVVTIKQVAEYFNIPYINAKQRVANLRRKGVVSRISAGKYKTGWDYEPPSLYEQVLEGFKTEGKAKPRVLADKLGITHCQMYAALSYLRQIGYQVKRDKNWWYEVKR